MVILNRNLECTCIKNCSYKKTKIIVMLCNMYDMFDRSYADSTWKMGNSISRRLNSSSGLSLYPFNSMIGSVINFSKRKTLYIPKYSSLVMLGH